MTQLDNWRFHVNLFTKKVRKKWRVAAGCFLIILIPAMMVLPGKGPAEPVFEGKPLSGWLRLYPYTIPDQSIDSPLEWRGQNVSSAQRREMYLQLRDRHGDQKLGEHAAKAHDALIESGQDAFPVLLRMLEGPPDWKILHNRHVERMRRWLELSESIPERIDPYSRRAVVVTAFLDLEESGCDMRSALPELEKLSVSPDAQLSLFAKAILQSLDARKKK